MFTGIIQHIAIVKKVTPKGDGISVILTKPMTWKFTKGASVSVQGVCSTIIQSTKTQFSVDYMPETLQKTTIRDVRVGDRLNIERSMRVGDELGGHIVSGHIETVAIVKSIDLDGENMKTITFRLPTKHMQLLVSKGSIAVDGISLTVVHVGKDTFSVSLIPHTLSHTTLGKLQVGARVNIEFDVMAKYIARIMAHQKNRNRDS